MTADTPSHSDLRKAAEIVCNQVQLIDACGQLCVDSDSITRGVRMAFSTLLDEISALRGALEEAGRDRTELVKALSIWMRAMESGRSEPLFVARDHTSRVVCEIILTAALKDQANG